MEGAKAFAVWQARLARMYTITVPDVSRFAVAGTTWQLPHGFVNHARLSPCAQIRSAGLIADAPIDHLSIFRCRSGQVAARYAGVAVTLEAGDMAFLNYMHPIESVSGDVVVDSAFLARDVAPARLKEGSLHGVVLRAQAPAGQLIGTHLDALVSLIGTLTIVEAETALLSLFGLAAGLWPTVDTLPDVALLDRARAVVTDRFRDPALTPEVLAAELGMSRAMLYRVFKAESGVSAFIQTVRLDHGLKMLIDDTGTRTVAQVAAGVGFRHTAHFSRVFKARFGLSPSEAAEKSVADMGGRTFTGWLEAQGPTPPLEAVRAWLATST